MLCYTRESYVVISTHSLEFIEHLLRIADFEKALDMVKVVVLEDGYVKHEYSGHEAFKDLMEIGAELRGV